MFIENITVFKDRTQDLVDRALQLITKQMSLGNALIVAWSGGKDSSAVLNLVLRSAAAYVEAGNISPRIIVTHADPGGVENPAVAIQANKDMDAIKLFAEFYGINVEIKVSTPSQNTRFAVKVIGGRDLPVYSGLQAGRKCTQDWKVLPMQKMTKHIVKEVKDTGKDVCTILGTRFDESTGRKARMEGRGETADNVWLSDKGELRLSPIADWSDVDLWRYLHACARGEYLSYSTFSGLIELYKAGSDPADVQTIGGVEVYACRFGCAICTAGKDKSMGWMLKNNPEKYGWMEGLHKLQQYKLNIQHDLDRRNWVCFDLYRGYARLRPNTFSPSMMEELLRYVLTLQVQEYDASGGNPRFQIISLEDIIAIDATWSLQGHHKPFHALRIYRDVAVRNNLAEIPQIEPLPQKRVGETKYFYVNEDYASPKYDYSGMDLIANDFASFDNESRCIPSKILKDGRRISDLYTTPEFTVNAESICFLFEYELDRILDGYQSQGGRTSAYKHYVMVGHISLAKGAHTSKVDQILRRTVWKEEKGLAGLDPRTEPEKLQNMLSRSLTKKEMEAEVATRDGQNGVDQPEKVVTNRSMQLFLPGLELAA